jgi:CheY-like chemotaxis protein/HPt (histidine-containing phosphotransfer) domain-containing protein
VPPGPDTQLLGTQPEYAWPFVVLGKGPLRGLRRLHRQGALRVNVGANLLTRRGLIDAVALAAGRGQEADGKAWPGIGEQTPIAPSRQEALLQGRLILIAEDNETNQKVFLQQLALLGFAADVAGDGQEALALWHEGNYALLLTDLNMPNMDGYELSASIRMEEQGANHLPIVALSANAFHGEAMRCYAAGMDDFLAKPTPLVSLRAVLDRWLPPAELATATGAEPAAPAPVDVAVLKELVGDDPAVLQNFLKHFQISAARTAAALQVACATGEAPQAAALAHKLKSSARSVGALALGELCAELERAGRTGGAPALAELWPRFEAEMAAVEAYLRS